MWDWVYHHHSWLVVVLVVAAIVAAGVLVWARRRESWPRALVSLVPIGSMVVVGVLWPTADKRSNERDIATRVAQVERVLPDTARRIAHGAGANFRTDTYRLETDLVSAVSMFAASLRRVDGGSVSGPFGGPGRQFIVGFRYRGGGCGGTVEVTVTSRAVPGATETEIAGYCED